MHEITLDIIRFLFKTYYFNVLFCEYHLNILYHTKTIRDHFIRFAERLAFML